MYVLGELICEHKKNKCRHNAEINNAGGEEDEPVPERAVIEEKAGRQWYLGADN